MKIKNQVIKILILIFIFVFFLEEPTPKTFILVKDRFEYFKPKIHVEYENPDKNETVSELYIKGWKIELNLMNIFQQALPNAEKLSCIK